MKRENAKQALERYMHYYQRWAENDKARLQVALQPVEATGITAFVCNMCNVSKQPYSRRSRGLLGCLMQNQMSLRQ